MKKILATVLWALPGVAAFVEPASALCSSYPNTLTNGATADGGQVMANFNCAALTSGATIYGATLTGTTTLPGSGVVSSTGNLGIGISPSYALDVSPGARISNAGGMGIEFANVNTTTNRILSYNRTSSTYGVSTYDASSHQFLVSGAEKGRVDTSGRFLWGTTTPSISGVKAEFDNAGNNVGFYMSANVNAAAAYFRIDYTTPQFVDFLYGASTQVGSITTNGSNTSYNTTSDERLKDWSIPQRNYHQVIRSLWVGDFAWKSGGHNDFGIRAQQAYSLVPYAVRKPAGPDDYWQADYSKLAPLALWGVKDLYRSSDASDQRIASLEGEVKQLHQVNSDAAAQISKLLTRVAALERRGAVKTALK
jgi:hypothetical protein